MDDNSSRIFFKKIEITDCGRYYDGPHELLFTDPKDKNITIIYGDSGSGKSTIHDLIYWCLYGSFVNREKVEDNEADYGLLNTDKLETLMVGEEVTGNVSVTIHDEKGEKYFLTRKLTAKCLKESIGPRYFEPLNNSKVRKGTSFEMEQTIMYKDASGKRDTITDPFIIKNRINGIFPQELSDFFLFNGENLEKFEFASTSTGYVKKGIEQISGLMVLDKLMDSSKRTSEQLFTYVNGQSVGSSGLNATYTKHKNQADEYTNTISKQVKELDILKLQHEQIVIRMDRLKDGKKLNDELAREKKSKTTLESERVRIKQKTYELMFKNIPNLLAKKTFQNCEVIFGKLEDEDKIPPAISRKAIDKILNSDPLQCVCGRSFSKNDDSWNKLEITKKGIINEHALNTLVDGADLIGRMLTTVMNTKTISDNFTELTKSRDDKSKSIEIQEGKILDIDARTTKIEDDKGEDLGAKKVGLSSKITDLDFSIKDLRYKLEELVIKKEKTKLELDKNRIKESGMKKQNNKINILNTIVNFANTQRSVIVEKLRTDTEYSANTYFKKSVAQSDSFEKLNISPKFEITARDARNNIAAVSKGQGHVLGLSYVCGVREITEVKTSLVIDSPLHNISSDSRNKMAQALADNLPGVQLILLVTDTEYLESKKHAKPVRDIIKPSGNLWKEYEIIVKKIDDPKEPGKQISVREFGELEDV